MIDRIKYRGVLTPLLGLCFALGCQRSEVGTYVVPKEDATRTLASAPAAGGADMNAGAGQPVVRWTLPAGWFERQGDPMRVGSFAVTNAAGNSADVSVIPLAGTGGNDLGNVNRWRGQVGLEPITDQELAGLWEKAELGGLSARLVDLVGKGEKPESSPHMLAAMTTSGNTTWFFKMVGEKDLVAEQKPAFLAFLKSVQFTSGEPAVATGGAGALPAGHPPLEGAGAPTAAGLPAGHPPLDAGAGAAKALAPMGEAVSGSAPAVGNATTGVTLPVGWAQQPPKPMQSSRYVIKDGGHEAEVSVTELDGDAGGPLANVNRWRGQIGLGQFSQDDFAKIATSLEVGGTKATLVDLVNEAQHKRLVAVILPREGKTVFYKLVGEAALAQGQKEAFVKFIQAAK